MREHSSQLCILVRRDVVISVPEGTRIREKSKDQAATTRPYRNKTEEGLSGKT